RLLDRILDRVPPRVRIGCVADQHVPTGGVDRSHCAQRDKNKDRKRKASPRKGHDSLRLVLSAVCPARVRTDTMVSLDAAENIFYFATNVQAVHNPSGRRADSFQRQWCLVMMPGDVCDILLTPCA